jgi:hypothetical protein
MREPLRAAIPHVDARTKRGGPALIRRRRLGLGLGALTAAAGGAFLLRGFPDASTTNPDGGTTDVVGRAAEIGRRHGLQIGFGDPAGFYTPPFGPADALIPGGVAEPAATADLGPALDGIATSLALYPAGFYARFCRAIFLCGPLLFAGERAGGTYGRAWIILAADPFGGAGGIRETARLGVHHEFSSLVLPHLPGLAARWAALLPVGWHPILRTEDALRQVDAGDARDGFLSAYAATSVENDFNTYAETAFGNPALLAALAETLPVVKRKAALLLDAYTALDSRLADTFRDLRLGNLPPERIDDAVTIPVRPSSLPRPRIGEN